jgi:DNA-binding protein H-NS
MSTYRNVKAQIAKLEKQASDLFKKEVDQVVAKVRGLIAEYGLTAADLGFTAKLNKVVKGLRKKSAAKPAGIPMYVDPVSGKTWTGKGKQPTFIVEGLKKGKSKSDFLIVKKAAAPVAVAKAPKAVKAAPKPAAVAKPAKKVAAKPAAKAAAKKVAKKVSRKVAAKPAVVTKPAVAAA